MTQAVVPIANVLGTADDGDITLRQLRFYLGYLVLNAREVPKRSNKSSKRRS